MVKTHGTNNSSSGENDNIAQPTILLKSSISTSDNPTKSLSNENASVQLPSPSACKPSAPKFLDPLVPPVVRINANSKDDLESKYQLSRLGDHTIYDARLFLAYMHDAPESTDN